MIDRQAREKMAVAVRDYMNEKMTAFDFDEELIKIMNPTTDKTVQWVGQQLWYYYDDCKDHKIVATKEEWDYFNRLLLLLDSDGEMELTKKIRWHFSQVIAATCLALFTYIVIRVGMDVALLVFVPPFGIVSMIMAWINRRQERKNISAIEASIVPFHSIKSLLSVRRTVPDFVKARYPKIISSRKVRSIIAAKLMLIPSIFPSILIWMLVAPIILFFQMLPGKKYEIRIKMPETAKASPALQAHA